MNCIQLAHKDTIVIVDDIVFTHKFKRDWSNTSMDGRGK